MTTIAMLSMKISLKFDKSRLLSCGQENNDLQYGSHPPT